MTIRLDNQPWIADLGVKSDREIAAVAGVCPQSIANIRRRRGIARPPKQHKGPLSSVHDYAHLFGTVPDAEIARLAGVTRERVRQVRQAHGAQRCFASGGDAMSIKSAETRQEIAVTYADRLGVVPDTVIADLAGVCAGTVAKVRREHEVPAAPKVITGGKLAPYLHLLGTMPDVRIAEMADTCSVYVCLTRKKLGIASFLYDRKTARR